MSEGELQSDSFQPKLILHSFNLHIQKETERQRQPVWSSVVRAVRQDVTIQQHSTGQVMRGESRNKYLSRRPVVFTMFMALHYVLTCLLLSRKCALIGRADVFQVFGLERNYWTSLIKMIMK